MKNTNLLSNDQVEYLNRILANKEWYKKNLGYRWIAIVRDYGSVVCDYNLFTFSEEWEKHNPFYDIVEIYTL